MPLNNIDFFKIASQISSLIRNNNLDAARECFLELLFCSGFIDLLDSSHIDEDIHILIHMFDRDNQRRIINDLRPVHTSDYNFNDLYILALMLINLAEGNGALRGDEINFLQEAWHVLNNQIVFLDNSEINRMAPLRAIALELAIERNWPLELGNSLVSSSDVDDELITPLRRRMRQ